MKFSIVTPSYNQADFLEDTILSVVSQKTDIEYFIQDGGSTDESIEIIKKYSEKYPDIIHYVSREDGGQVNAINDGFKKTTGEILAYINSDDYYLPGAFREVEQYFNNHPDCMWLIGDCHISDNKLSWTFTIKHLMPVQTFPVLIYLFNWINQPSVFIRRELFERVGSFNTKYHYAFDYDYWLRCSRLFKPHRYRLPLSVFRIQPNSKGNTGFEKQFTEDIQIVKGYTTNKIVRTIHYLFSYITLMIYSLLKTNRKTDDE